MNPDRNQGDAQAMTEPREPAASVRFLLDGERVEREGIPATRTVLGLLRDDLGRPATKEGCAEGDCGACTVVLVEREGAGLRYRAVNSCIQFAPSLDGKAVITAAGLKRATGALHPVQQALADGHGSQCGFCTPGFVMSLFALYKTRPGATRGEIEDALAGNLCRCTGYRPIVDAAQSMYALAAAIPAEERDVLTAAAGDAGSAVRASEARFAEALSTVARKASSVLGTPSERYFAPRTVAELARLRADLPQARLVAGGTDVGLWVTKQHRDIDAVISVAEVSDMKTIRDDRGALDIGAAAIVADAHPALVAHFPELDELLRRYGSPPIRNAATLGGNIANGSPVGDSMPVLIALGVTLVLRRRDSVRELPLEDFYPAYRNTALAAGEFVERIRIPPRVPGLVLRAWKVAKRFDQDISAVCGAFAFALAGTRIASARVAFGGMAATPKRARACEDALTGETWDEATLERAVAALEDDFAPLSDLRASTAYRRKVAGNLLRRLFLETARGLPASATRATGFVLVE
jgi:xanthine dehydrogenase small subunit